MAAAAPARPAAQRVAGGQRDGRRREDDEGARTTPSSTVPRSPARGVPGWGG